MKLPGDGKNVWIAAILILGCSAAHHWGYIDSRLYDTLINLLLGGGLVALRAGQAETCRKVDANTEICQGLCEKVDPTPISERRSVTGE